VDSAEGAPDLMHVQGSVGLIEIQRMPREASQSHIAACRLKRGLIWPFGIDSSYFLKCDSSFPFMVRFDERFD
jgi:hypothetical protein